MDKFDLGRLTAFDFERVCKDLFSEILGRQLEIFTPGPDGGVDLRYLSPTAEKTVVQCKHWERSKRASLLRHLEKVEGAKVRALAPARYILASSVEATPDFKASAMAALAPYVGSTGDIYGVDEIVAELDARPGVVRKNLRLWLSSAAVLDTLLNKSVMIRSATLVDELEETLRVYAPNGSFTSAVDMLDEHNVCIIAGIPGIGKTTLARVLSANYLADGFELVEVSEDVEELFRSWDDSIKQVFYYDDFLGQTTLEDKLHKNEDSRIITAIKKVRNSPNKKLLLTTREYILAQAKQRYEKLARQDFEPLTYVIDLGQYTSMARAEILYNHLSFSDLDPSEVAKFAEPSVYEPIIRHHNFNPRTIALSLELGKDLDEHRTGSVYEVILKNLNNPSQIWDHIVEYELNASSVAVLMVLFSHGPGVDLSGLEKSWVAYLEHQGIAVESRQFRRSVNTLEETMLRTTRSGNRIYVSFHNPSVIDYLREYLSRHGETLLSVLRCATSVQQFRNSFTIANGRGGEALEALFHNNSADLGDSLMRVLTARLTRLRSAQGYRDLATALKLANQLNREDIFDYAASLLTGEWADYVGDPDDLVQIVLELDNSQFEKGHELKHEAAAEVARWVFEDVSEWDLKTSAVSTLEALGDLAPEGMLESLEERMRDEVAEALSAWEEPDEYPGDPSLSRLGEMVSYASNYADPASEFPGYSNAAAAVSDWENSDEHRGFSRFQDSPTSSATSSREVGQLMGLLAGAGED